ncbi:hypothetical protein U8607_05175 [Methylobacterium durans]|uniref:hypothetical protein n=1 Tax=Methylobacterium durans TaxID=2202825 RepID=UPI002AFED3B1|nr:hypothetical protein [Methylobacterium durans]MEA1831470.1 hypothetical protein [Methylobacterium durans]
MRRAAAIGLALLAVAGDARAQEAGSAGIPPACTAFDWSLMRELAWFSASSLAELASGATVAPDMPGAVLKLRPDAEVAFPVPPSRAPAPGTYGGILRFPALTMPGLYQVTLSEEAWIDVSQDGQSTRPPTAFTVRPDCPTIRKSVRYQFGTTPILIEVSGAKRDTIRIAIAPAE